MEHKRAILLTEDENIIFRFDTRINLAKDLIEYDIFKSLIDMEKGHHINLKKLFNMLKVHYGLSFLDSLEVYKEAILNEPNWKILPVDEEPIKMNSHYKINEVKNVNME